MEETVQMPKSKFVLVACRKCKNEQVIFNKAASLVKCTKCSAELVIPLGGESMIHAKILKVL